MGEDQELSMVSDANKPKTKSNRENYMNFKNVKPPRVEPKGGHRIHERIWLGTCGSTLPFSNNISLLETKFQMLFTPDIILDMIQQGSYPAKFADFLKTRQVDIPGEFLCSLLFQKELTPSDVGKLNRLVIPKRYAQKHFPSVPNSAEVELEFYDRQMRLWKFRYCYWKSSQSFVFTRGWNRFVREKGLRAKDTIAFYACERHFGQSFLVIDVVWTSHKESGSNVKGISGEDHNVEVGDGNTYVEIIDDSTANNSKGFRLFGVQIVN